MSQKELYVCLVTFKDRPKAEPVKVLTTAIAPNVETAKELAVRDVVGQFGLEVKSGLFDVDAHPIKRSRLEEAAREVLGWRA